MKTWVSAGVEGLYLHGPTGRYYGRYQLRGKRHFQSLKTDALRVAKLRVKTLLSGVEERRQAATPAADEPRTLGDLAAIYLRRLEHGQQHPGTKAAYQSALKRLRKVWGKSFDTTLPRNVSKDTLMTLRKRLSEVKAVDPHRTKSKKLYRPSSVNDALRRLKDLLGIAREFQLIVGDPFLDRNVLQERVWLPAETRRPVLPSRADMDRIFDEMEILPNAARYEFNPGLLAFMQKRALRQAEHARFLAYSGARLDEANTATFERYFGAKIHLTGTKTKSADRTIPTTPPLRALVAKIREREPFRRGKILSVASSLAAIQRACKRLSLPHLTHHDLRHYFATVCIESGVDFLTVSVWLGQSDGGVLLMNTYGHLRDEHSLKAMELVNFSPRALPTAG